MSPAEKFEFIRLRRIRLTGSSAFTLYEMPSPAYDFGASLGAAGWPANILARLAASSALALADFSLILSAYFSRARSSCALLMLRFYKDSGSFRATRLAISQTRYFHSRLVLQKSRKYIVRQQPSPRSQLQPFTCNPQQPVGDEFVDCGLTTIDHAIAKLFLQSES